MRRSGRNHVAGGWPAGARPIHALGRARLGQLRPAHLAEVRAAVDAEGMLVAYEYQGWQHGWTVTSTIQDIATWKARASSGRRAPPRSRSTR